MQPTRSEGLKLGVYSGSSESHVRLTGSPSKPMMVSVARLDLRRFSGYSTSLWLDWNRLEIVEHCIRNAPTLPF